MRSSNALLRFSQERNYIQLEGVSGQPTIKFNITQQQTVRGGVAPLVTEKAMLLKPRTRTRTLLSVTDGSPLQRLPGKIVGLIDKNEFGKDARHCLAHSISNLKKGKVICEISNFTGKPAYIPAGTIIGSFAIGVRETELIPLEKTVLDIHQDLPNTQRFVGALATQYPAPKRTERDKERRRSQEGEGERGREREREGERKEQQESTPILLRGKILPCDVGALLIHRSRSCELAGMRPF